MPTKFNYFNAESRFGDWIRTILGDNVADFIAMDIAIIGIETHSFRKGIATFLSSLTSGPTPIAIYLRAGWSLGLQKQYIMEGGGGDQLCGQTATGGDVNGTNFAAILLHIDMRHGEILSKWEEMLPGFTTFFLEEFQIVVSYLLASIIFHADWLKANLDENHPLFTQPVWTSGIIGELRNAVHAETL